MMSKDNVDKQVHRLFSCNEGGSWIKMHHLAEAIADHQDAGAALRISLQPEDKVETHKVIRFCGN